ncbi:hypothetical protein D3C86_1627560 [compost metagenome]
MVPLVFAVTISFINFAFMKCNFSIDDVERTAVLFLKLGNDSLFGFLWCTSSNYNVSKLRVVVGIHPFNFDVELLFSVLDFTL